MTDEAKLLLTAAAAGSLDDLRRLAASGADLNQAVDSHKNTAAEVAARAKHWEFVLEVGKLGGDLHKHGLLSCLAWAVSSAPEMCAALLQGGCPHSESDGSSQALRSAAEKGLPETVDLLLDAGAALNTPDGQGRTALSSAARMGHAAMVTHLLERGADPDGTAGDNAPVLMAEKHKRIDCLRILFEANASPNVLDSKGLSGLERAKKAYQNEIVTLWEDALARNLNTPPPIHHVHSERAKPAREPFASLDDLLQRWGTVQALDDMIVRVSNGPWTAWVHRTLAEFFDCTLALELYGADPEATWPVQVLQELTVQATQPVKQQRAAMRGDNPDAPMPSLAAHLAARELELRFHSPPDLPAIVSEEDWGRALVDLRPDAFGGRFSQDGAQRSVAAFIPLTTGELLFRQEGVSVAQIREAHEALDRDILASLRWRNAWHGEVGGSLSDWLAKQVVVRERVSLADGKWRTPS